MSHAHAASDAERLPWLKNERKPAKNETPLLLAWGIAATALVAGVSYWVGMTGARPEAVTTEQPARPSATVRLPEPGPAPAPEERQVAIAPMPQVEPVRAPAEVRLPRAKSVRTSAKARSRSSAPRRSTQASRESTAPSRPRSALEPWPVRVEQGSAGRLVQIGTFSTRRQAKRGWRQIMRLYPGMQRLPALVVGEPSQRNGRTYYRLQMGTTSQAHSAILCQRMRMIGQSCIVHGT